MATGVQGGHEVAIYSPVSAVFFGGIGDIPDAPGVPQGGGAELQMALLARGLADAGLSVALIVWPECHQPVEPNLDLIERPIHAGFGVRGKLAEGRNVWRGMKRADAGAYVFRGSGPALFVAAAFCRIHRRKLVFSAAIDLDFDFQRPDRRGLQLMLTRNAVRRADLIVAQREAQAEIARDLGLGPVVTIPSYAEPVERATAEPEAFLWIGRLVAYKRPLAFIELAESLPDARFRMVWFATDETPRELIEKVEQAGERLDNLELLGQLPRPEVLDYIERSTAVVSTSEAEGMPNVFLEAWSRAVPVISLDYDPDGKIQELGLGIVAGGSPERMVEAARSLWSDRDRRTELGRAGRAYVRDLHSPEAVSERWAGELRRLLGSG